MTSVRDGAPAFPDAGPIVTGTYAQTDALPGETLPSPAPAGPYGTALSAFNGTSANGTWSLYIVDDEAVDTGSMTGWSLRVTMAETADYAAANGVVTFTAGQTSRTISVTVHGDSTPEPNETFFVNLSNASLGSISDNQGLGTIQNDDAASSPSIKATAAIVTPRKGPGVQHHPSISAASAASSSSSPAPPINRSDC